MFVYPCPGSTHACTHTHTYTALRVDTTAYNLVKIKALSRQYFIYCSEESYEIGSVIADEEMEA